MKKSNNYCLYCHINKIDGKHYFGITQQKVKKRWQNGYGYIDNAYFYRAIQKYGWKDGVYHIVLKTNLTTEEACYWEQFYIEEYKTNNSKYGYNLTIGGDVGSLGHKSSKEFLEMVSKRVICLEDLKIYESATSCSNVIGTNFSNLCKCCKDNESNIRENKIPIHECKGKHYVYYYDNINYEQYRDNINEYISERYSKGLKQNVRNGNTNSSDIIHINTGMIYENAHQINRVLGYSYSDVSAICKAYSSNQWNRKVCKKKSIGNYNDPQYFMYVDDFNKYNIEVKDKYRELLINTFTSRYRPIINTKTNQIFYTATEASKMTHTPLTKIRHHIRGDVTIPEWEYVSNVESFIDENFINKMR